MSMSSREKTLISFIKGTSNRGGIFCSLSYIFSPLLSMTPLYQ